MTVEAHEAAHASAALLLGRTVSYVRVEPGIRWRDEVLGGTGIPLEGGRFQPSDLIIRMAGYWGQLAGWPPPWPAPRYEDLEELDQVCRDLDLDRERYEQLVRQTEELLANLDFRRLRDAIARLLRRAQRLEAEDLQTLAAAYGVAAHEQPREEPTWSA